MSEYTPDDILRMAQERISARKVATRRSLPWGAIFLGSFSALLLALLFSPGMPLEWKMYAVVHGICAQQHNIFVGGLQFPLCARNSGIYLSFMLTFIYLYAIGRGRAGKLPPWHISLTLLAFVGIMAVDGFNSLLLDLGLPNWYQPDNFLRTLTGMGMGITIATMLHIVLNNTLRQNVDPQQPVFSRWSELLGIIAIDLLALAAIYGNLGITFWPLAFLAFFGILGVLYLVCLLLTSLFMGYEGKVTHLRQLAQPATIALIPTLLIAGMMSWLRFWMESMGLVM
ncbi:DUF2085 domain-containing protein [Chloroflexus sp. Y-396-1]|uniref:DUF2085 domain-containing protein n=1 Tax=Chloroflexus sp. Y-396-1 TaxID=867845 RepID=UPI00048DA7F0|nr:DUF2085 domain-containing protein [Chloroflexus sp. Y-396-1]